ncbi:MAG: DUF2147 domain-containing protein [Bacteroidetes bacterium]|nr:DUF2147 domain-containing protein [Bacteroidota bacterium]
MKTIVTVLAIAIFPLLASFNTGGNPDAILGDWMTVENNLKVHVYKENGEFRAKITWFDDHGYKAPMDKCTDTENPDSTLRNRKVLGLQVLSGLTYSAEEDRWINGKIYDSNTGHTFDSVVWMAGPDKLTVKGYYLFEWIGQTLEFYRVK